MAERVAETTDALGADVPRNSDHWTVRYRLALEGYLAGAGESELRAAREIGRTALADGAGLLDMAILHHAAMERVLPSLAEDRSAMLRASGDFLAESLASFEMAFRGYRDEANNALQRVNDVLEHESKRMAHFIHDEVGQVLFALHSAVADLNRRVDPSLHPEMQVIAKLALNMEERIRQLSHELRPVILEDLGLVPALEFLARGVSQRSGIVLTVLASLKDRLPLPVETVLYRVIHEALANVVKHSRATRGEVVLEHKDGTVHCSIRDDGVGCGSNAFEGADPGGLGLIGIRERVDSVGGGVHIRSHPNRGTQLHINIPVGG